MKKEIEAKETQEIKEQKEKRKKTIKKIAIIGIGAGVLVSTTVLLKRRSRNKKYKELTDLLKKIQIDHDLKINKVADDYSKMVDEDIFTRVAQLIEEALIDDSKSHWDFSNVYGKFDDSKVISKKILNISVDKIEN